MNELTHEMTEGIYGLIRTQENDNINYAEVYNCVDSCLRFIPDCVHTIYLYVRGLRVRVSLLEWVNEEDCLGGHSNMVNFLNECNYFYRVTENFWITLVERKRKVVEEKVEVPEFNIETFDDSDEFPF